MMRPTGLLDKLPDLNVSNGPPCLEMPTVDDRVMWDIWMSIYHFPALTVTDQVGLLPFIAKAPSTSAEIASTLSLNPRLTSALLGILASLGLVTQYEGKFYITDITRNFMLPSSPYYWGGILRLYRDGPINHSSLYTALIQSTPEDSKEVIKERYSEPDDEDVSYITAIHGRSLAPGTAVAQIGDFSGVQRLLDVGGGLGGYCLCLAQKYSKMTFTILELPWVCELAQQYIASYGLQDRIETFATDMFKTPWPAGHDAVFLSNVFADLSRERRLSLAQKCFEALPQRGRIYLHEMLLTDTRDGPLTPASFAMNIFTEGEQPTAGDLFAILKACGFEELMATNTYGYYTLISGRKP